MEKIAQIIAAVVACATATTLTASSATSLTASSTTAATQLLMPPGWIKQNYPEIAKLMPEGAEAAFNKHID